MKETFNENKSDNKNQLDNDVCVLEELQDSIFLHEQKQKEKDNKDKE